MIISKKKCPEYENDAYLNPQLKNFSNYIFMLVMLNFYVLINITSDVNQN